MPREKSWDVVVRTDVEGRPVYTFREATDGEPWTDDKLARRLGWCLAALDRKMDEDTRAYLVWCVRKIVRPGATTNTAMVFPDRRDGSLESFLNPSGTLASKDFDLVHVNLRTDKSRHWTVSTLSRTGGGARTSCEFAQGTKNDDLHTALACIFGGDP